ncbi:hypothetical protein AB0436_20235 [Streptomyces sp. NPDC051322]|uniref:hypothetical protein n=1 Tax=Streptomyces sp. NPDC051322 TaxID=3154645 RepID=UPI00344BE0A1
MNRSRVLPVAVSLTVAAALLLTGCGGGDRKGSGNGKLVGADTGSAKRGASPSSSAMSKVPHIDRPDMKFPADVELVFDDAGVTDPDQAAALGDAENFVRAVIYGIVEQDADDAVYKFYSEFQSPAQKYAKQQIDASVGAGLTVTGVSRYTGAKIQSVNGTKDVVVTFCSNDSRFYSKETDSGKIRKTKMSVRDYSYWQIGMHPKKATDGLWRANEIKVQGDAARCVG